MNTVKEIAAQLVARHEDELMWVDGVPSPCQSICQMKLSLGRCVGCYRTSEEIAAWSDLDDACKRDVWDRLLARAKPDLGQG